MKISNIKFLLYILLVLISSIVCKKSTNDNEFSLEINSPFQNDVFTKFDSFTISVNIIGRNCANQPISIYIDNKHITTLSKAPYNFSVACNNLSEGGHTIKVIADKNELLYKEVNIQMIEFTEESPDILDISQLNENSWYIENWDVEIGNTGDYIIQSDAETGVLLTTNTFTTGGSIQMKISNQAGNFIFYIDGVLISSLFKSQDWDVYNFYVSEGTHSFKFWYEDPQVLIENISFHEGIVKHSVGEHFGGGVIFDVDSEGVTGLISAYNDFGNLIKWGCLNLIIYESDLSRDDGYHNTLWINENCEDLNTAARICEELIIIGNDDIEYDDWYLPSFHELCKMYLLKDNIGGFSNIYYWSSYSVYETSSARVIDFKDGRIHSSHKNNVFSVRPVRKF